MDEAPVRQGEAQAVFVRRVLYGASFGTLGATLGWFTWVAAAILLARTHDVWISALVGGLLGLGIEGVRHYWATMRSGAPTIPTGGRIPLVALLSSISGVFFAVSGENALGELIKEVRLPFLLSLITFSVGGAVIAAIVACCGEDGGGESDYAWFHLGALGQCR